MAIEWRLRPVTAERELWQTSDLRRALEDVGAPGLSQAQVYRLVSSRPGRLNLDTLDALCRVLACNVEDILRRVPDEEPST
ncbi:helix-turn-helix transcriptional regulator [Nocardioides sp. JQ2195]|uniref:helix-turn-helix domain-containing protein n=1 Tax=Nocardioides sp. JQ2195 TaxID=2592334 RepID=UPI00143EDD83|nr:helix-turn-helix transcriptional regulator [Nocardioides sp. JQ2195]QIX27002.1 helix-turn-helix transcriptional regulator [Nocardioides sp. JQ2195]